MFKDPLVWWKAHEYQFHILAKLAKNYLAVQPSSAPSECIFSVASRLLSARHTTIDPEFDGKTFFVSQNWEWFEKKVSLAQIEWVKADGVEGNNTEN